MSCTLLLFTLLGFISSASPCDAERGTRPALAIIGRATAPSAVVQGASRADRQDIRPTLAVVGMSNEIDDAGWRDARIGMGVRALLAQLAFETGRFVLIEEKAEVRDHLLRLADGIWDMGNMKRDDAALIEGLRTLEPDYALYGRVVSFGRPRTKMSFGALHSNTQTTEIRVEITLHHLESGVRFVAEGKGASRTTARSALFTFREDNVDFDVTNVGSATKKALASAMESVMAGYVKRHQPLN